MSRSFFPGFVVSLGVGLLALTLAGCTERSRTAGRGFPPCSRQSDCGAGQVCTTIGCCPGCHSDADCPSGQSCNPSLAGNFCAPQGSNPTPNPPAQGPGPNPTARNCLADNECAAGQVCNIGTCVRACGASNPCPGTQTCSGGRCYVGGTSCGTATLALCSASAACGAGRVCAAGQCHASCSGATCPLGQVCSSGTCIDDPNPATPQCAFDSDCGVAFRCLNANCHPLCGADDQCSAGNFCDQGVCRANYLPAT